MNKPRLEIYAGGQIVRKAKKNQRPNTSVNAQKHRKNTTRPVSVRDNVHLHDDAIQPKPEWVFPRQSNESENKFENNPWVHSTRLNTDQGMQRKVEAVRNRHSDENMQSYKMPARSLVSLHDKKERTRMFRHFPDSLVIHSFSSVLDVVPNLTSTYFHNSVIAALKTVFPAEKKIPSLHKYTWPLILRGHNVCAIFDSSNHLVPYVYIAPIFSLMLSRRSTDDTKMACKKCSPQCIIVVNNYVRCLQVHTMLKAVLSHLPANDSRSLHIQIAAKNNMNAHEELSSVQKNIDVLIATPSILKHCLSRSLDLRCLAHLVVDLRYYAKQYSCDIIDVLQPILCAFGASQRENRLPQFIVCASRWSTEVSALAESFSSRPVLVFENYLEAVFYGKIELSKKKIGKNHKKFFLEEMINNMKNHMGKMVIFCGDEDELEEIRKHFLPKSIHIECVGDFCQQDIEKCEQKWLSSELKVLACTDVSFGKLKNVGDATVIVHYSIPSDWHILTSRFRAIKENIPTYFSTNSSKTDIEHKVPQCCFLVEEKGSEEDLFYEIAFEFARCGISNQRSL